MGNKFKNNLPIIALIVVASFLAVKNFTPGTFLSGWDTLHPEFNFGLNFTRQIFGVFRNDQGIGAVAAHSHMADLPHLIILYLLHFLFAVNLLRYLYIFLNLIIGPLGMYLFLNKTVVKNKIAAFLGGLFYLLNLGTMQQFVVPFEMFVVEYGLLPWLFLFASEYLFSQNKTDKKFLLLFSLVTLLATPMAYAATLWYVYFSAFILYLSVLSFPSLLRRNLILAKKSLALIFLSLLINSFWILPNIYFVLTQGASVAKANINVLFSPQAFLYNKEFGNFKDIALLKTFYFDWGVYAGGNHFANLLQPFIDYLNKPYVVQIGYFFAIISLVGLVYAIYKKNRIGIGVLSVGILALFFLINDNFPTSFIYNFLARTIPLFGEAFRFPDDKVLGLFIFVFAVYFAFGQLFLVNLISKIRRMKFLTFFQILVTIFLLVYFMLPAFKGFFISPYMRIRIPSSYFNMFSWFNSQKDNGRIANLPINSQWGWEYYDWGEDQNTNIPSFQGSDFISFGIKQPILDRDFDRWNPDNEQYYREMSYAIYSENTDLLKKVIEKYNIHYILLDKSIIAPENDPKVLAYKDIDNMSGELINEGFVQKSIKFGNGLEVYKISQPLPGSAYSIKDFTSVSPAAQAIYEDFAFEKFNNYIVENSDSSAHFYPFRTLIDAQNHVLSPLLSTQEGLKISLKEKLTEASAPSFIATENSIAADLFVKREKNILTVTFYPHLPQKNANQSSIPIESSLSLPTDKNVVLSINDSYNFILDNVPDNTPLSLGIVFLKTKDNNTVTLYPKTPDKIIIPDFSTINLSLAPCGAKSSNQVFGLRKEKNNFVLFGKHTPICMSIPIANLISNDKNLGERYLFTTNFEYQGEPSSYMCIANTKTSNCQDYVSKNIASSQSLTSNYFEIKQEDLGNLGIKIVFDATQKDKNQSVSYSNVVFSLTKPFSSSSISQDLITESIQSVESISSNTFIIPFSGTAQLSKNITTLPKTSLECNSSSPVSHKLSKKIVSQEKQSFIEYKAGEGVACDHFSYQNLSQNQAYLIEVSSRNIKGLPLTMCVLNENTKHCDLYTNLTKSPNFTSEFFLLPPMREEQTTLSGQGYDIDIGSLGIKRSESINDLQSIQIIPFPYRFLSQIQIDRTGLNSVNTANRNLLVFPVSFNSGWRAYRINFQFAQVFPFLFGTELKNHVLVNNWENGWLLNNPQPSTFNSQLVIIYLPQYLEYIGFILLFISIIYIIRLVLIKN